MTGALGGLTTFSTFSAEAFGLLHKQQYVLASSHILSHVVGSLVMTALGFWLFHALKVKFVSMKKPDTCRAFTVW